MELVCNQYVDNKVSKTAVSRLLGITTIIVYGGKIIFLREDNRQKYLSNTYSMYG